MPECYGSWAAAYAVFRRWQRHGIWARILTRLHAVAGQAGRIRPQKILNARYFALLPDLEREERELGNDRERWLARQHGTAGKPPNLRADWKGLSLAERRTHIKDALVHPAKWGARSFDANRMEPVWRQE